MKIPKSVIIDTLPTRKKFERIYITIIHMKSSQYIDELTSGEDTKTTGFVDASYQECFINYLSASHAVFEEVHSPPSEDFTRATI